MGIQKKGRSGKEKKNSVCFPHTSHSYCKTNKELYNCGPGRFAILCSSNMQHNNNPRLFWWISRSGHFAFHSTVHSLCISLIKPEWFWLHMPIFWLKALKKHLLDSYQHRRCEAQSSVWEAIPRGQGIHTEQKRKILLLNLHLQKPRHTNQNYTEFSGISTSLLLKCCCRRTQEFRSPTNPPCAPNVQL